MTADSKIIRALEIVRVKKKSYIMQFYEKNIFQMLISRLYTIYNKHEIIKIYIQTREKSQVLSQMLK